MWWVSLLSKGAAIGVRQAIKTVECRLLDSAVFLDIEALNLLEVAVVRSVDGDESGDDSEPLGAVHLHGNPVHDHKNICPRERKCWNHSRIRIALVI